MNPEIVFSVLHRHVSSPRECGWLRACGKARVRHFEHLQLTSSVQSHPHSASCSSSSTELLQYEPQTESHLSYWSVTCIDHMNAFSDLLLGMPPIPRRNHFDMLILFSCCQLSDCCSEVMNCWVCACDVLTRWSVSVRWPRLWMRVSAVSQWRWSIRLSSLPSSSLRRLHLFMSVGCSRVLAWKPDLSTGGM